VRVKPAEQPLSDSGRRAKAREGESPRLGRRVAITTGLGALLGAALSGRAFAGESAAAQTIGDAVILRPGSSGRNVIQPTVSSVIPLTIRGAAGQSANLQEWQDAGGTRLASLSANGRNLRLASSAGAPSLASGEQASPGGGTDYLNGLTHNWRYAEGPGGRYDDSKEMGALTLESWWGGFLELNIDMQAPGPGQPFRRPLGFNAAYDGSFCGFGIGPSHAPGAGGVQLFGGTNPDLHQLTIIERQGATRTENLFVILRQGGAASFAWKAGGIPRLLFDLSGVGNALGMGNNGVLKFAGNWTSGEPIVNFESVGLGAVVLSSHAAAGDPFRRVQLLSDGRFDWGSGAATFDTNLYRKAPDVLRTDDQFQAGDGLVTKVKAGPPTDADFRTATDGCLAIDSVNGRLYARIGGQWRSVALT
jgi:hypothetical protein